MRLDLITLITLIILLTRCRLGSITKQVYRVSDEGLQLFNSLQDYHNNPNGKNDPVDLNIFQIIEIKKNEHANESDTLILTQIRMLIYYLLLFME